MTKLDVKKTFTIPCHESTENAQKLQLVIEQHSFPSKSPAASKTVNILWSHANGFHKETLHPLMRRVAKKLQIPSYQDINFEFYAWDGRNQGDSGRLNVDHLPLTFSWQDHASDIHQIVEQLDLKTPQTQLIGIGHSVGATATILCEFRYPGTFDAIIALEPILQVDVVPEPLRKKLPMLASRKRRDTWDSFEDAYQFFASRAFWKTWDPEALDLHVRYGLYQDDNGKVRLKCQPEQEYAVYWYDRHSQNVAYWSLRALKIPIHIVFADNAQTFPLGELKHFGKVAPTGTYSVLKGGHIIPLEQPDLIASEVIQFLKKVVDGTTAAPELASKL
ncbi:hypothetical protein Unana1_07945 [Umbelopsis nana]